MQYFVDKSLQFDKLNTLLIMVSGVVIIDSSHLTTGLLNNCSYNGVGK